jgi:hypothetical protein
VTGDVLEEEAVFRKALVATHQHIGGLIRETLDGSRAEGVHTDAVLGRASGQQQDQHAG